MGGGLGVIDGLGTSFDIRADTVVVARSKSAQVTKTVEGNSIFWCAKTNRGVVTGDLALSDVVGSFSAKEEAVTANDGISSESWSLRVRKSNEINPA